MESTKEMVATFGRARWLGERTIGHQDPRTTVVYLVLQSVLGRLAFVQQQRSLPQS